MPSLQGAYARYGHQISFLGVDTKDDINSAKDFLAAFALHYPQVADANGDLLHKVGGAGLPVTLVLNTDGKTVYSHRGELRSKDLQQALRAAGIRTAQS
jgi:cytochrome c biogenesis protein CcmG/thiol:disulfide interchange protein DsbE